jgi:hypothetical protein
MMGLLHVLDLAESQGWRFQRYHEVCVAVRILIFENSADLGEWNAEEKALSTVVCLSPKSEAEVQFELLLLNVDHKPRMSLAQWPDSAHYEHYICHDTDRQASALQRHLFEMPVLSFD